MQSNLFDFYQLPGLAYCGFNPATIEKSGKLQYSDNHKHHLAFGDNFDTIYFCALTLSNFYFSIINRNFNFGEMSYILPDNKLSEIAK